MEEEYYRVRAQTMYMGEDTFVPRPQSHAWMGGRGPQRCAWCDYVGNNKNEILGHELDHHGRQSPCPRFYCQTCGEGFETSGFLRIHARHMSHRIYVRYAFPGEIPAIGGPAPAPAIGGPEPADGGSTGPAIGGPEPADGGSTGPAIGGPAPAISGSTGPAIGFPCRWRLHGLCLGCGTWGCQGCIRG